ncbi:MAG TPA: bifunctional DNA-binding transcriptional regulator/O6-methylguanine-DNA methyltransferase Ada [Polyangia bacterium]
MIVKPGMPTAPETRSEDSRWVAVCARDARCDGTFYYAVTTTGVYCRPSCPSRPKRRENVVFHDSADSAERAGFRPCRRCHPRRASHADQTAAKIAELCRIIEVSEEVPSLAQLARKSGWSTFHTQRVFKAVTGVSPRDYAAAHRSRRLQNALWKGAPVTAALYDAGYGSSGRFYEAAPATLGMTPSRYRSGGAGTRIEFAVGRASLGCVLVAATERGVCAILIGDTPEALRRDLEHRFPRADRRPAGPSFAALIEDVVGVVDGHRPPETLPLDVRGTAFQQRVWQALQRIPAGSTLSYTALAARLGVPRGARAVARACATNPIAVAIPCHRVVRETGDLAGYRWGLERKRTLLAREKK